MGESKRPEVPPPPPPPPPSTASGDYQRVADTIGMVPSLRKSDNLVQGICVGAGSLLGAIVGLILGHKSENGPLVAALVGLLIGMVASALVGSVKSSV